MRNRFYETVTVRPIDGVAGFDMPCHMSMVSIIDPDTQTAPNRLIRTARMTFPTDRTVKQNQQIEYRGQVWVASTGEQIHTRRGRILFKSADLERVTG